MTKVSVVTPDKIDARVEKCMQKLNFSVDELNHLYKIFEERDREGKGLITIDDFFDKILRVRRSYYGESVIELIEPDRVELLNFGEFLQVFSVYCLFETQDVLRLCFFMFDKKKTGYVKREEIKNFIHLLHEGEITSNAEQGMKTLDDNLDGDGRFDFRQLRILHRNFPHLIYPAFRLQIIMQRVTLGEPWWNKRKMEMYLVAEATRQSLAEEQENAKKGRDKMKERKAKQKERNVQKEISIEFRVRERMGYFRYNFMPWTRKQVYEEIETLDSIEAELDGEQELPGT